MNQATYNKQSNSHGNRDKNKTTKCNNLQWHVTTRDDVHNDIQASNTHAHRREHGEG